MTSHLGGSIKWSLRVTWLGSVDFLKFNTMRYQKMVKFQHPRPDPKNDGIEMF